VVNESKCLSSGLIFRRYRRTWMDGWMEGWIDRHKDWPSNSVFKCSCHVFRRVRKICEKRLLASSCLWVRPHGTTRLPLDGFSWNLVFEYFSKICRENSSFVKIGQKIMVLYLEINVHFRSYLTQFFLKWKLFQVKVVEKLETHIFTFNNIFLFEIRAVYEIMWKNIVERSRPQMTVWRMRYD
jgi:hypothetical protein